MVIFHNSGGQVAVNPDRVAYVTDHGKNGARIYFSASAEGEDWIPVREMFDVVLDRLAGVEGSR